MANGHSPDTHPLAGGMAKVNTQPPRSAGKPKANGRKTGSAPKGGAGNMASKGKRVSPVKGNHKTP